MGERQRRWFGLAAFLAVSFAAGGVGNLLGGSGVREWYPTLTKPSFTPPAWVFGPVWSLLYAMMGVAAWLVWRERGLRRAAGAMILFAAQLVCSAAWSGLFFGLRSPGAALADIAALWGLLVATVAAFWRIRPAAAALLLPYLGWVSFAAILNYEFWRLNR